ncbi:hypothetical protein DSO57_1016801 [Entomophthora muscae]|uniref:Uncharacterized protein n=1 Tax=Entomophthora muscae TaxID=34485 RepID=A0ACC2STV1_9FUNG|nr:hypothetical protein DSO57_1016801 [Entomophthora muscae]
MLPPWYKVTMWILEPISLLFWSPNPVFWNKLFLISQSPGFAPGLLVNLIGHLIQVPTNLASYGLFPWLSSYLRKLLPPLGSGITETPFSDLDNPSPTAVSASFLPSVHQIPVLDPEVPPTWDHSLWLLSGALVMVLDSSPPLLNLAAQTTSLVTCINGVAGTLAVQQIKINEFGAAVATSWDISGQNSSTLDTLEESLQLLWARQSAAESEFEGNPHINVLNPGDNSQSTSLSIDPN